MKLLHYIINSWKHFGTVALFSKAWEKYIVDKRRFRPGLVRTIPTIPNRYFKPQEVNAPHSDGSEWPLNICYLIHYFFPDKNGGTERFILNLAKEQQRLGNNVRIITLGKREPHCYHQHVENILYEEFEYEGLLVTQFRYRRAPRGLYYDIFNDDEPNMLAFAQVLLDKYQFDLIHAAYPQPFTSFLKVCRIRKIPYLVTTTDFNVMCHYATLVNKSGQFCISSDKGERCRKDCKTYGLRDPVKRYQKAAELLHSAGYVTAPSEFVARVLSPEFGGLPILVVPHGISKDFSIVGDRDQTKRFAYAGTLSDLKGVHLLIEAFRRISDCGVTLDLYGDGETGYVNRLKTLAKGDPRITFHGGVPGSKMKQVYQRCDCVVIPSMWFETYNFVLREALSCGCLAIASEIGAMPEAIIEGKNGFLFTVGDLAALQEALEKAISFNWDLYQKAAFPKLPDEAMRYSVLYRNMLSEEKLYAEN